MAASTVGRSVGRSVGRIDLIHGTIFDYVIRFRMAKAHERPYATVCKAVSKEA